MIGASGGIGAAVARELEGRFDVTRLSRSHDGFDITDEATVDRGLRALNGPFARIVVTTGALKIGDHAPEKALKAVTPEAMIAQFRLNALGPALVVKHCLPLLDRNTPAVVGVLSARVGSITDNRLGGWMSYRTAKAALNQIVRTTAIEWARTHKQLTLLALHPGTVVTDFTKDYLGRHPAVSPEVAAQNLCRVMDQVNPSHSGQFLEYTGQEIPW